MRTLTRTRDILYLPHVAGVAGDTTPAPAPPPVPPPPAEIDEMRRAVVILVNAERGGRGLPSLTHHDGLMTVAQLHADDMRDQDYYDHDSIDGRLWWQRIVAHYPDWQKIGECIAAGYKKPEAAFAAWMSSPGHRDIIIHAAYRDIGVGYASGTDSKYPTYWVLDVGVTG